MPQKINTFIFDCFGVICRQVYYSWYRDYRLKQGNVDPNILNVFEKFDLGKMSEDEMIDYYLKYEGVDTSREELKKQVESYLNIDKKLVALIKELREKKFKIALLSNANVSFFKRKLYPTYPEFRGLFDEMIISSEVGMIKPHKDIYEYTLKKIGSEASESLFVDDNQANVDMANALGMIGFLYSDFESFRKYLDGLN